MKAIFYFFLFCYSTFGFSQTFHGGMLGNIIASQVDGDSYSGYNKAGISLGVFINTSLRPNLDARFEIKYTLRGAKNKANKDNIGFYMLSLNYIDLPLLLSLKFKNYGSVNVGIIPGYLFAVNGKDDAGDLPDDYIIDFKKFDLGSLLGISININRTLSFDMRYSYSLISVRDIETAGAYYSWFGKIFGYSAGDFNNYLSFGLSYTIK